MPSKKKGLKFDPSFFKKSKSTPTVWDTVKWEKRNSVISGANGKIIFEMKNVEVPAKWSQLATDIVASKYFRKAGIPNKIGHESSVKELINRVADTISDQGVENGYFESKKDVGLLWKRANCSTWYLYNISLSFPVLFSLRIHTRSD